MMKFNMFMENQSSSLYHGTLSYKAEQILRTNEFYLSEPATSLDIDMNTYDGKRYNYFFSTSRKLDNEYMHTLYVAENDFTVVFKMNRQNLERKFDASIEVDFHTLNEEEQRLLSNSNIIKPIKDCIDSIFIVAFEDALEEVSQKYLPISGDIPIYVFDEDKYTEDDFYNIEKMISKGIIKDWRKEMKG